MKFLTDHYFHIGSAHLTSGKPCQDYAISGASDEMALAIVSDGCSTGRHTDVGSRLVVLSTAAAIREYWTMNRSSCSENVSREISLQQKLVLAGIRQALGLQPLDMLATCMYAFISPEGGIIHIQGDGVVALKYLDGNIAIRRFEWADNTPWYPAYQDNGMVDFIKAQGDDLNALRFSEEKVAMANGEFSGSEKISHTLGQGIRGITLEITKDMLSKELEIIALFSDGVTQIDKLDWKEAVVNFLAFKNVAGEFAKRRMISGIREIQKTGKGPLDDISYGVIRIENDEEKES